MTAPPPSPYAAEDAPGPGAPPSEADVPTPPRGMTAQAPPGPPGPPPELPPTAHRRDRARIATAIALVVGLLGTAWASTDYLRGTWRSAEPRTAVVAGADGSATLAGITVRLVEAVDLGATPSLPDTDWQPPAGFHAWRVVLETSSTNADVFSCDVALVDGGGRRFVANQFVDSFVEGYEYSYTCGVIEPEDEIGPEQALLVLVPEDAEPRTVQVSTLVLNPDYLSFDIG